MGRRTLVIVTLVLVVGLSVIYSAWAYRNDAVVKEVTVLSMAKNKPIQIQTKDTSALQTKSDYYLKFNPALPSSVCEGELLDIIVEGHLRVKLSPGDLATCGVRPADVFFYLYLMEDDPMSNDEITYKSLMYQDCMDIYFTQLGGNAVTFEGVDLGAQAGGTEGDTIEVYIKAIPNSDPKLSTVYGLYSSNHDVYVYNDGQCKCLSGACCALSSRPYKFKSSGSQPTGFEDYYHCSGTESPTDTSYVKFLNWYCTGSSSSPSYTDDIKDTCGLCKYCTSGNSKCSNYPSGTSCGTGKKCDGSGNCLTISTTTTSSTTTVHTTTSSSTTTSTSTTTTSSITTTTPTTTTISSTTTTIPSTTTSSTTTTTTTTVPATKTVCKSGCTYSTVQAALDAANLGDTIVITDKATYKEQAEIKKDNIVLDCNGATLDGSGLPVKAYGFPGDSFTGTVGIFLISKNNFIVKNCIIKNYSGNLDNEEFGFGILAANATNFNSNNNTMIFNMVGIAVVISSGNIQIKDNIVTNNSYLGVLIGDIAGSVVVENNVIASNNVVNDPDGVGLGVESITGVTLNNNKFCPSNNNRDIELRFSSGSGSGNSCEKPGNWNDNGKTGCTYGCTGCVDECSSGQTRCNGNYKQTCGNYDADSCLEWPTSTSGSGNQLCQYGCANGQCKTTACSKNSDCGTDTWTGTTYCGYDLKDIFQKKRIYTCNNPGTVQASCSSADVENVKSMCGLGKYCRNGACFDYFGCLDSDGGLGYWTKGSVLMNDVVYNDYCYKKKVVEYYCKNGKVKTKKYKCNCIDGRCV